MRKEENMNKAKRAAVRAAIVLTCAVAGYGAGRYAGRQEPQESREPQAGYILIHTTDGEAWGFYGDMEIISDGADGGDIEIEMSGWLVGSTHDCYNPDPEE